MNPFTIASGLPEWHDFFEGAVGAAAALAGLIFVAVSMNLRAILTEEKKLGSAYLTGRALESLVALLVILGVGLVGLDPSDSTIVLASMLAIAAMVGTVSPIRAVSAFRTTGVKPIAFNLRLFLALTLVATYLAAAITLMLGTGGGLNWLPFAFVLAVAIAASNAWILLVEVLR
jgi:hypothetical protein